MKIYYWFLLSSRLGMSCSETTLSWLMTTIWSAWHYWVAELAAAHFIIFAELPPGCSAVQCWQGDKEEWIGVYDNMECRGLLSVLLMAMLMTISWPDDSTWHTLTGIVQCQWWPTSRAILHSSDPLHWLTDCSPTSPLNVIIQTFNWHILPTHPSISREISLPQDPTQTRIKLLDKDVKNPGVRWGVENNLFGSVSGHNDVEERGETWRLHLREVNWFKEMCLASNTWSPHHNEDYIDVGDVSLKTR